MTTTILPLPPELAESDALRPLIEKAGAWVDDLVSDWPFPLTVEWYRVTNGPTEDLVGVRVSGENATAHGVLTPAQLAEPDAYRSRLAKVFNVMLQSSAGEHLRKYRLLSPSRVGE